MSKHKRILFLILSFSFLSASTCKNDERLISLTNNSENMIYYYYSYIYFKPNYPDTTIKKDSLLSYMPARLNSSTIRYSMSLNIDTLSLFIFDSIIVNTYPWETIRKEYKVLKRYDLSKEDIKKLNWLIAYPPTPEMRYMKQFPAYGE